ncbi:MAG: hypothetical protein FIA97_15340 [Methylococcaceae bacterium]|nr:hypothetical protein [Methylococcaceae bacterium]
MKAIKVIVASAFAGLIGGCAASQDIRPHDWALEVQNADTRSAHLSLADHYEEVAKTMDADAAEERRMLAKYQANPHKYGKQILDLKARSEAMILDFENAARESRKMAEYHRQFASESR